MAFFNSNNKKGDLLTSLPNVVRKKTLDAIYIIHLKMLHEIILQLIKKNESLQGDIYLLQNQLLSERIELNNQKLKFIEEAVRILENIESVSLAEINQVTKKLASIWSSSPIDLQRIHGIPNEPLQARAVENATLHYKNKINCIHKETENIRNESKNYSFSQESNSSSITSPQLKQQQALLNASETALNDRLQELDRLLANSGGKKLQTIFFATAPIIPQTHQPSPNDTVKAGKTCTL